MYDDKERIGIREVMKLVGMSRYRITESMNRGDFPQCWRPSPRVRVWDRQEVIAWFETTRSKPKGDLVREIGQVKDELYRTELELRKVKAARDKAAAELDVSVRGLALSEAMRGGPARKQASGSVMADSTPLSGRDIEHLKKKKAAAAAAGDSPSDGDGAEADAGQDDLTGDDVPGDVSGESASKPSGRPTDEEMDAMVNRLEKIYGGSRGSAAGDSGSGDDAGAGSDGD